MPSQTVEIVYRWPDGREEVRYRRPYGSESAEDLIEQVHKLQRKAAEDGYVSPYFWRPAGWRDAVREPETETVRADG
jgi:hypothetical protein